MPNDPIFFSYSRSDSGFVLKLAKDLRKAGANVWLDQLDIKAGSHWDSSVETALNASSRLLVILSPASVVSNNVMDEVSFALENNKTVIPVLLTECAVPFRLRRVQRVDFTGDYQDALNQLMEVLGYSQESSADAVLTKTQPYLSQVISNEVKPIAEEKDNALETSAWENAKTENTLDAFIQYLQQYTNGTYQTDALAAIKKIEDNEKQKAIETAAQLKKEETENKLWDDAISENVISSYQKYLDETVTGLHTKEAQQLISKLAKEQQEKALEASVWENAKTENTLVALKQYVQQYPNGTYQTDALAGITVIQEREKQKAIGSAKKENIPGYETVKKNNIRKYIFIGIGALVLVLILWKIISPNSEKLNNDNANDNTNNQSELDNTIKDKLDQANSYFNASQYDSAWMIYKSLDENKLDSHAMFNIAVLYDQGDGIAQDHTQAKIWYEKAADAGSTDAMFNIGTLYDEGSGVAQDYAQAKIWYEKAAAAGSAAAMNNIGTLYDKGTGVAKDHAQANVWYEKAAAAGNTDAMDNLGDSYYNGDGVSRDYAQAKIWYEKAADAGNAKAMNDLGDLYFDGDGVSQDYAQAKIWYQKACDAGEKQGCINLKSLP